LEFVVAELLLAGCPSCQHQSTEWRQKSTTRHTNG